MKKVIGVLLILVMVFSITACGQKEKPVEEEVVENNVEEDVEENTSEEVEEISIRDEVVGGWTIANIKFDEADDAVKEVFNRAKESMEEELIPVTFIGSQVVSGTNYGFLCKDTNSFDRYVYIYQNANNEIETIEISKPGETLDILPTQDEITAIVEEQEQDAQEKQETKPEKEEPKNAEEALVEQFGSKDAAINSLLADGMTGSLNENNISLSYQYDDEFSDEEINIMKDELISSYKDVEENYIKFVKDVEAKTNSTGVIYSVRYTDKSNKEIVTITIDNKGMR